MGRGRGENGESDVEKEEQDKGSFFYKNFTPPNPPLHRIQILRITYKETFNSFYAFYAGRRAGQHQSAKPETNAPPATARVASAATPTHHIAESGQGRI